MRCLCFVAAVLSVLLVNTLAATLFPFGPSAGDSFLPYGDDGQTASVNMNLTMFATKFTTVHVNNNGVISLN